MGATSGHSREKSTRPARSEAGGSGDSPQPPAGRRRGSPGRWVLRGGLALLLVLAFLGALVYRELDGNITSVDVDGWLSSDRPPENPSEALNILLLGSDSRAGANGEYGDVAGRRSDTAMVVHLAEGRRKAAVVSIPRDTLVDRPECPGQDRDTIPPARDVMFNSAYARGGLVCTVATVEKLGDLRLDHAVAVDFAGFEKLVDTLGGVRITLSEPIEDSYAGLDLPAGTQRLTGEQALGLVRTRHGVGNGSDLARIELQQKFLRALLRQVDRTGLLTDPVRLHRVLDTATSSLTTDEELASLGALWSLTRSLRGMSPERVDFRTLPVAASSARPNRLVPKESEAKELWKALREDSALPPKNR
ncbi:LCP family protein [Actinopolyspora mortivallis]|uniref:LCP family protein n=1 Tax=Actinopolyspora mortivallis TaxID=33906 RepID=UPI002158E16C|nr:LCP family protein [Actinopolyspora mortivallis]